MTVDRLWRIPKVAQILDVPHDTIYNMARRGELPGVVRIGRMIRVDSAKLLAWLDEGGKALAGGWRREAH
ncbi:Helix-turn-helix domain protein [compost metagenome]